MAAQRQDEVRYFPSFVTSTVVHGAEKEWYVDRCELTVERHLDGRGQEQAGNRTQHRTEGQLADLPICFRV